MRQKVGIAVTLAEHTDVLLIDEPTRGLGPKTTGVSWSDCFAHCQLSG